MMSKSLPLLVIVSLLLIAMPASNTEPEAFWSWFLENEERIFDFEQDQEQMFDELAAALQRVHPDLTFEFSPKLEDGTREFVISAGGMSEAFPAVETLVATAPDLPRWTIIRYRPRRSVLHDITFGDRTAKASDVHYLLFHDERPGRIGIALFFDGYSEEEEGFFGQVGFLFLDEALGEYDVATKVGAIDFLGRGSEYFDRARPLSELVDHFDSIVASRN